TSQERKTDRISITHFMQRPALVINFERQRVKLFCFSAGIGISDRLVNKDRGNLNMSKVLAREFAPLCFGQCQDLISDRRIERLQTLKLLKLCLVQSQKGQFERQSCFAHNLKIVKY